MFVAVGDLFSLITATRLFVIHGILALMMESGAIDHVGRKRMCVWIRRGFLSLAILGLLAAPPAQAQNGLSRAAAIFDA